MSDLIEPRDVGRYVVEMEKSVPGSKPATRLWFSGIGYVPIAKG